MKTSIIKTLSALVALAVFSTLTAYAQGTLTPTGAPGPTMKSLAQIEPRKPISALPANLTASGSYYLTANLTTAGGIGADGITINSSDVTVDLGGFDIVGGGALSGSGITLNGGLKNIVIRNGTIRNWGGYGVYSSSSSARSLVFEHLNISDCQVGINALNAAISDCNIFSSSSQGINATACTIGNCSVTGSGIQGVSLSGGTLSHCVIQSSGLEGLLLNGSGCVVNDNLIKGNNTGNGAFNAGLFIDSANNRIENNQIIDNGATGYGIFANGSPTGNLVIKNFVSGNGAKNYGISAPIIFGPIITATGSIGSSNPWANFSY